MTTAYTSLLGLALPVQGELTGTWGDTVNNSITSLLDTAVAGTTTLSTDADVTLTTTTGGANQARQAILLCSGARTALRTITAPAQSKSYLIINATTGGFGVKIVGVGPTTGVTVLAGQKALVAWNGSDFVVVANDLAVPGPIGATTASTGAFTTASASSQMLVTGSGFSPTANSSLMRNVTGQAQWWANGPDVSTSGNHLFVVARSDGTSSTSVAQITSTGLAVTGTVSASNSLIATAATGEQSVLMGNQDAGGAAGPNFVSAANGSLYFGRGTAFTGTGGTHTYYGSWSSTGLAVTGTGSFTSDVSTSTNFILTGVGVNLLQSASSNATRLYSGVAPGSGYTFTTSDHSGSGTTWPYKIFIDATAIGTFSSTGLAVIGTVSSTGNIGAGAMLSGGNAARWITADSDVGSAYSGGFIASTNGGVAKGYVYYDNSSSANSFLVQSAAGVKIGFRANAAASNQMELDTSGNLKMNWGSTTLGWYFDASYSMGMSANSTTRTLYIDNKSSDSGGDIIFRNTITGTLSEKMKLDVNANLLLNGATAGDITGFSGSSTGLGIRGGSPTIALVDTDDATNYKSWIASSSGHMYITNKYASGNMYFGVGSNTAMTLDANGYLNLVTANSRYTGGSSTGYALFGGTEVSSYMQVYGSGHATRPYGIDFVTAGALRAQFDQSGNLLVGTTSAEAKLTVEQTGSNKAIRPQNSANSFNSYMVYSVLSGTSNANTTAIHYAAFTESVDVFRVYGNGNVVNTNNSYGSISDIKVKENIVDAPSYWDKYKQLKWRNFNLIADPDKRKQLGLIAQEAELIFPGVIDETPDRDQEGNDLGTTTKSVKYSIVGHIADTVLQEAQARIEELEAYKTQAENLISNMLQRIAALEAK